MTDNTEPVAWLLRTGHGDKLEFTRPDCLLPEAWRPLYLHPRLGSCEDEWKNTVIDSAVVHWVLRDEHYTNPRMCLNDIIDRAVEWVLDPVVSLSAENLVDQGRKEVKDEVIAFLTAKETKDEPA